MKAKQLTIHGTLLCILLMALNGYGEDAKNLSAIGDSNALSAQNAVSLMTEKLSIKVEATDSGGLAIELTDSDGDLIRLAEETGVIFRFWDTHNPTVEAPLSVTLGSAQCPNTGVSAAKHDRTSVTLHWPECSVANGDTFRPSLTFSLQDGSDAVDIRVAADSTMERWSFYSAVFRADIVSEDGDSEQLLTATLGYVISDPATAFLKDFRSYGRSIRQQSAYLRGDRGLFVGHADRTGDYYKDMAFDGTGTATRVDTEVFVEGLIDPSTPFEMDYPLVLGRFTGDWVDFAHRYRSWLATVPITSKGTIQQQGAAYPAGLRKLSSVMMQGMGASYEDGVIFGKAKDFREHYGLDKMLVFQFGTEWVEGGDHGVGSYTPNMEYVNTAGAQPSDGWTLYMLDSAYELDNPTYQSEGWESQALTILNGDHLVTHARDKSFKLMDPRSEQWKQRVSEITQHGVSSGAVGLYVDNLIPWEWEHSIDPTMGPTGFGPSMSRAMADMLDQIRTEARAMGVDDFVVQTEYATEGYIRSVDTINPDYPIGMMDDVLIDRVSQFPLQSHLYHEYVLLGPTTPLFSERAPCDPDGKKPCPEWLQQGWGMLFSATPELREQGKRHHFYIYASGIVDGAIPTIPDPFLNGDPNQLLLHQLDPSLTQNGPLKDIAQLTEYAGQSAALRQTLTDFLVAGKRHRDLDIGVHDVEVALAPGIHFDSIHLGTFEPLPPQTRSVPAVLNAVYEDRSTGNLCIVVANHTEESFVGNNALTFGLDLTKYGLQGDDKAHIFKVTSDAITYMGIFPSAFGAVLESDAQSLSAYVLVKTQG